MEADEPPLIIIHGTRDPVVPFTEAEKLRDRAVEVELPHVFHPLEGIGHAPRMPVELMAVVAPFFYEQMWPAGTELSPTPSPTDMPTATATRPATETREPTPAVTSPATSTPTMEETVTPTWRVYLPSAQRE